MVIYRHKKSIRDALLSHRDRGQSIALVATMGNLHEGHLQLIQLAKQHADVVVATIFVNPLQFGLNEDWEQYPRTFESDCDKLECEECDYLFFPEDIEMYPHGLAHQTRVISPTMTDILCGASRPGHFEGVTTVVTKLFHIVEPDVAIFGKKDYQQLAIIRRMTDDLCMDIDIIGAPIARDSDGLALSSRNSFITATERPLAMQLYATLQWLEAQIRAGNNDYRKLEKQGLAKINDHGFRADYISIREAQSLENATVDDSNLVILGAMYTSKARLIDNIAMQIDLPNN